MAKLFIDTSDSKNIEVCLILSGGRKICKKEVSNKLKAQMTLPLIRDILKKSGKSLSDVNEVDVISGPGSFTGLRVGISIANALSFSGLIKVNGKEIGEIEEASY